MAAIAALLFLAATAQGAVGEVLFFNYFQFDHGPSSLSIEDIEPGPFDLIL